MNIVNIFIGSVTGTAEQAGKQLGECLIDQGYKVNIKLKPSLRNLNDCQDELLLVVTSTTGEGELPNNFRALWRKLYTKKPELVGITFSVAVFGDTLYGDDFCLGGIEFDALLNKLGAKRLRTPLLIDELETDNPNQDVIDWGTTITNQTYEK